MGRLKRTQDEGVVGEILQPFLSTLQGEHWKDTLANPSNVFLVEDDNLIIFEKQRARTYLGHFFYNSARGRKAINLTNKALTYIYKDAIIVEGWTPLNNRPALLMARWLGFKSYGQIDTFAGPMELFIMTKDEWRLKNG